MHSTTKLSIEVLEHLPVTEVSTIATKQAMDDQQQEYFDLALKHAYQLYQQGAVEQAYAFLHPIMNLDEFVYFKKISSDLSLHLVYLAKFALELKHYQVAAANLFKGMMYAIEYDERINQLMAELLEELKTNGIEITYFKQFQVSLSKKYVQYLEKKH